MIQEDVGSPKSTSLLSTFHIGSILCFFPANSMSSTYTDKNNPFFHGERISIPNLEFSPSHVSIGFSQIAFPTIVLPKDDRKNSFQEERLGLPYWTMISAICVVVDESKCLDTPILEFSIIGEPWTSLICVSSPKCVYMCVRRCPPKHQMRLYVCHQMRLYVCHQMRLHVCHQMRLYVCHQMRLYVCHQMRLLNPQRSSLRSLTFARFARTFFNSLD